MYDNAHLSVPNHYHADKDYVDVSSQRFVVVNFVNLKGSENDLSLVQVDTWLTMHFMQAAEGISHKIQGCTSSQNPCKCRQNFYLNIAKQE